MQARSGSCLIFIPQEVGNLQDIHDKRGVHDPIRFRTAVQKSVISGAAFEVMTHDKNLGLGFPAGVTARPPLLACVGFPW